MAEPPPPSKWDRFKDPMTLIAVVCLVGGTLSISIGISAVMNGAYSQRRFPIIGILLLALGAVILMSGRRPSDS